MKLIFPKYLYYKNKFYPDYGVLTEGDSIISVEPKKQLLEKYPQAKQLHLSEQVLLPGAVNAHNHCFQSLLRGIAADRPFLEWRDRSLYYYSPKMSKEDIYNGALFAFGEMMKRGVTTVGDFFYLHNYGRESDLAIIQAAKDLGIRLSLNRTMYDWDGAPAGYVETVPQAVENTLYLAEEYKDDPMVNILPAPHSLHAATPEMIQRGHEIARKLNVKFHIHVAEEPFEVEQVKKEHDGLGTLEYLDRLGVVDDSMVIIHGVWLSPEEIALLGEKKEAWSIVLPVTCFWQMELQIFREC